MDLQNTIKTTDTFIDKFLPFRMFKELSSFLQLVLPEEMVRKVRLLETTKVKELYALLIKDEEMADFKKKMTELQEELGYRVIGTREKERQEVSKIME